MPYTPRKAGPSNDREFFYWVYQELGRVGEEISTVSGAGGNVPVGGSVGQALVKTGTGPTDFDWGTISVTWASISGKPSTFTPSAHTHLIADVTGLQTALDAKLEAGANVSVLTNDAGYITSVSWGDISGIPASFPPDAHVHAISDVTGLTTALAGKSDVGHGHSIAEVSGLQTALDGKQAAGSYAAATHTHTKADITDLNDADYATAAQGALADTALQPGDVVGGENLTFHEVFGGIAHAFHVAVTTLLGGDASTVPAVSITGGDASTLFLDSPVSLFGGNA